MKEKQKINSSSSKAVSTVLEDDNKIKWKKPLNKKRKHEENEKEEDNKTLSSKVSKNDNVEFLEIQFYYPQQELYNIKESFIDMDLPQPKIPKSCDISFTTKIVNTSVHFLLKDIIIKNLINQFKNS